ncbi:MAG: tRNA pseudouridine(55) synthase TruB [bacterium]
MPQNIPTRFTPSANRQPPVDPFDGVLLVDKPAGPTSHDIVAGVRRMFRIDKVGHGGTLDPNATGLLVLLLGRGTRLSAQIMGGDKAYEGVMRLGRTTNSQDIDGETIEEKPCDGITEEQIRAQMEARLGDSFQTPPMVSAVKIKGVPLYKLARKGQEVAREPRFIHLYRFKLLRWESPLATFDIVCTKGTYVRTLCHEIGQALGCGACLDALRRTASGTLKIEDALPFDDVLKLNRDALAARVIPFQQFLSTLPPADKPQ